MMRWLLERVEQNPSTVFSERELTDLFGEEFEVLRSRGWLERLEPLKDGHYVTYGLASARVIVIDGDTIEAIDEDGDLEDDPVPLTLADLEQWRLDVVAYGTSL